MTDRLSTLYQDLLGGSYDCVDRVVLTAYFRMGHDPGGFRVWWRALTDRMRHSKTPTSCGWRDRATSIRPEPSHICARRPPLCNVKRGRGSTDREGALKRSGGKADGAWAASSCRLRSAQRSPT